MSYEVISYDIKKSPAFTELSMMQKMGVEPTRYCYHTDLNRARLPIPPLLRTIVL